MADIVDFLQQRINTLQHLGAKDIIIDPGLGFNKSLDDNWHILSHLRDLEVLELPLLIGLSRKSMLTKLLNITADEALNATTAAHIFALQGGANILRVHDVKAAKQAATLYNKILNSI
jgi:dihydropteroate synthase